MPDRGGWTCLLAALASCVLTIALVAVGVLLVVVWYG